jgi:hypothetical protein
MSNCEWLSDRIPAVALGQGEWMPDEIRHLNDCASCRREWEIVQLASRLGQKAGLSFDPAAITAGVLRRLDRERQDARLRHRGWTFAGLTAAAAVVAAIWTGGLPSEPSKAQRVGTAVAGLSIPLPELDSLGPAELDSVLQTMDEPILGGSTSDDPSLGDLNYDELKRVLDS